MTKLVIFDSLYGNTEKIAQAIGRGIGGDVLVLPAKDGSAIGWSSLKLVVVGSPTQGGRPTVALQKMLDTIAANELKNAKVAAFDTRYKSKSGFAQRIIMKTIGFAADKLSKFLVSKGGTLAVPAEGFIVTGKEGPLAAGELERAEQWGRQIDLEKTPQ